MAPRENGPPRVFVLTIPGTELYYAAGSHEILSFVKAAPGPAIRGAVRDADRAKGQRPER